jgi:hypothetical protein
VSVTATRARKVGRAVLHEVPRPASPSRLWLVAIAVLVAVGALYHWLQSRGHVTPAVFIDELLFAELARSFAAGDGFVVRGEPFFFPAFVPSLLQAPAWLAGSTPLAYALAKGINTLLMCSAALPAYWLSRHLVRPAYALTVAASTIAGGGMVYHGYLTSEAAAYPVFLLAVALCVRALAAPSRGRDLVALAVLGLAVLTRAQFVVLPLAFALSIFLAGRPLRRHSTALAGLVLAVVAALIVGTQSLGFYSGAKTLDYPLGETLRWTGWTAALLPFAAGMLVAPGALLGLALSVIRPRNGAERGFGVLTALLLCLMPFQAGLIASGEAHKPFERYVFYLLPLVFLAFFAFAERRIGGRRMYGGVSLGFAGLALLVPFASLALTSFSFGSPTLSAVESLGRWTSQGDAAALVAAAGVLAALSAVALQRRPLVLGLLSVALAFLIGVAAYAGDRRMTQRSLASRAPAQPAWLERTGIREADVLILPNGSLHSGWVLESWNRNVGRTFHLGDLPDDPLPFTQVGLNADGMVTDGAGDAVGSRHLVVNDSGTQIELNGERLERLDEGLSLYRLHGPLRVRSIATGVYRDGWAQSVVSYRAWPEQAAGAYRVKLGLPAGRAQREVDVEAGSIRRRAVLRPGRSVMLRIPVSGRPLPELAIRIERADFVDAASTRPRLVGARIDALEFLPKKVQETD